MNRLICILSIFRMASEDLSKFSLEDTIGGNSDVLQRKAIHRIYGDKAHDIIEGLKKSPSVAVPVVLKRYGKYRIILSLGITYIQYHVQV